MGKLKAKIQSMPKEVKSSMAYTVCSVLQNGIGFFTISIFTGMMSDAEYGTQTTFNSWEAMLTIFLSLYLAYGSFNTAMMKYSDKRDEYISAVNMICIAMSAAFLAIYLPFRNTFNLLFKLPTHLIVLMVAAIIAKNSLACWTGKKRFEYKYIAVSLVTVLIGVAVPVLSYILVKNSDRKGQALVLGTAAVYIVIGVVILLFALIRGKAAFNKEYWKYALAFNIPLIPYYLSQSIFNQSDKVMIDHICGRGDAAQYGLAYSVAMLLTIVLNSLNNAYVPWVYEKIKKGERRDNQKMACIISIIMAVLLLGVVAIAPELIYFLGHGKPEYSSAVWVVPPVALSLLLLFYSQLFINVEFYFEEKKKLVYGTAVAAILNVVLNALLIPIFGYIVAAYTTLISYVVFTGMNYYYYKKMLREKNIPDDLYNMKLMLLILVVYTVLSYLIMFTYKNNTVRYAIIGVGVIGVLINIKRIIGLVKVMMKKDNSDGADGGDDCENS